MATITSTRAFITKSRSGHYSLTVKAFGTWEKDGHTYPYVETLLKAGKIELATAQRMKREFFAANA